MASYLVGPDQADDVTQETFLRMWRSLPGFRGDASGRTWMLSIARRTCADFVRATGRHRRLTGRIMRAASTGEPVSPGPEGAVALSDLVARLGPDRRVAFVLTQILGCSYEEAAAACGVPVGTIRSRVARARAELLEQSGSSRSMEAG
jgi:RNA polymerase sigma-70 factor (ECF subfamily)